MNERLKRIYQAMKTRCYNPKAQNFKDYGARGITICDEWLKKPNSFYEWALSNGYNDDLSIDRIDNNKGYSPENCRWATRKQQNNNQRRNHLIKYKGETKPLSQWCEELGLDYHKIKYRINALRWSVDKAFETKGNHSLRLITYKGRTQSLADWCRELNLKYYTVISRLNDSHWPVEKAFEIKGNAHYKMITYKGKTQHLAAWCKELKLNYIKVKDRINKYHWPIEKAFNGSPVGMEVKK